MVYYLHLLKSSTHKQTNTHKLVELTGAMDIFFWLLKCARARESTYEPSDTQHTTQTDGEELAQRMKECY